MATSTGVNVPTNTKIKEKDINSKLQLYGIYSGLSPLLANGSQATVLYEEHSD